MKNIYDGVVRTDGRGYATVRLPRWFQALNERFRYQLTTIRSFAQAIVWREVSAQQLRDPHPAPAREGLVAGDRHPPRRLRRGEPHQGRRGQAARPQRGRVSSVRASVTGRFRHDPGGMASAKLLIGGAGAAALTVQGHALALRPLERAARRPSARASSRWRSAPSSRRSTCAARWTASAPALEARAAGETLAAALVESAAGDPELERGRGGAAARGSAPASSPGWPRRRH